MTASCTFEGCTVGETGRCALEHDPNTCLKRGAGARHNDDLAVGEEELDIIGAPVLEAPEEIPAFTPSTTLPIDAINNMMTSKYIKIIGIFGDPESGKTAALASLYLLISNAKLNGWSFADSRSLMGFEEIARGARQWNAGNPPQQMTVHTEMTDERRPGFLHLKLKRDADGECVDLALPDIPGEWTRDLVRTSQTDRFQFIKSADVIWLIADGRKLNDKTQRNGTITRLCLLVGRLRTLMTDANLPRLLLVLTHHDAGAVPSDVIERINIEMNTKHQLSVEVIPIASFSDVDSVKAGTGLSKLIDATIIGSVKVGTIWPSSNELTGRHYLKFRGNL